MIHSLGPRWALTGPFMTSILGAGGNPGGYERMQKHLGPAFHEWIVDMRANEVEYDDATDRRLVEMVEAAMGWVDTDVLQRERNEVLAEGLRARAEKRGLMYVDRKRE